MTDHGEEPIYNSGVENSPLPNAILIKSICDQEVERLKFISCLGTLLEDFTDVETSTAKSFSKTISTFTTSAKNDCLSSFGSILEDISKFASQAGGKNHTAIANNISSNVCKSFPEYAKNNRKRVQTIFQKISAIQDDLKRAKLVQQKNEENYSRIFKEAEMCIRFRDNPDLYDKAMEAEREAVDKNMSFSKMISKMTTNDKKSPSERVADIIREIDIEERQLEANSKRLSFCRANLMVEIERGLADVLSIERTRIITVIDGFMKVFAIFDQFNHKVGESSNLIDQQLNNLKFDSSLHIPGDLPISECQGLSFIPTEEWSDSLESIHSGIPQVAVKVERFVEMLDFSILYLQKTHQLFDEVTDVERARNRSFKKLLEKYDSPTTADILSASANADSMGKLNKFFTSELSEIFPVRQMTASLIMLFRIMSDISARSGDLSMEDICKEVGAVQKRVGNLRKDLKDGYSAFLRSMEASYSQYSKLRTKLQKTQTFLKERNTTVKQAKVSAGLDVSEPGQSPQTMDINAEIPSTTIEPGMGAVEDGNVPLRPPSPSAGGGGGSERRGSVPFASVVSAAVAANNANNGTETPVVANNANATATEGNSLYRMASMKNKLENFGSSLRSATKLKQVVGLETPTDRINRIENQIVGLEKEERELQVQTKKAFEDLEVFMSQSSMDLVNRLMSAKSDLLIDLDQVKSALLVYIDWGKESHHLLGNGLMDLKTRLDSCEKVVDQELFSYSAENAVVRFEIPDIEPFVPMKSDIIDEERRNLKNGTANGPTDVGAMMPLSPRPSIVLSGDHLAVEPDLAGDVVQMHPSVTVSSSLLLRGEIDIDSDDEIPAVDETSSVKSGSAAAAVGGNPLRKFSDAESLPSPPISSPAMGTASPNGPVIKKTVTPDSISDIVMGEMEVSASVSPSTVAATPSATTLPSSPVIGNAAVLSAMPVPNAAPSAAAAAPAAASGATATTPAAPVADHELRRFGLDPSNKVLESFSCALYPKRGILTHGRLFITQHYLAFSGWPDTRVLLSLASVQKVEKTNTLMYIPNAISITCLVDNTAWAAAEGEIPEEPREEEYFFGSFIEREQCFNLIRNLSEIEKRIAEIAANAAASNGTDSFAVAQQPPLEFGYQNHATMFSWGDDSNPGSARSTNVAAAQVGSTKDRAPSPAKGLTQTGDNAATMVSPTRDTNAVAVGELLVATPDAAAAAAAAAVSSKTKVTSTTTVNAVSPAPKPTVPAVTALPLPSVTTTENTPVQPPPKVQPKKTPKPTKTKPSLPTVPATVKIDLTQLKKLESMITDHQLIVLAKKTVPHACHHFFLSNFRHGAAYTKYLETQNDFDISNTEWETMTGSVPEDVTKTSFTWKRSFNNMHPRTTMLMFGPKNCSVKQDQYLSLLLPTDHQHHHHHHHHQHHQLDHLRVYGGVLLTIYEFDGIPMGDVFKVLQYYVFTPATVLHRDASANAATVSSLGKENGSNVVVGLTIHFRKSTMFKSQIISGSSEESGMQARNWLDGAEKKVAEEEAGFLKQEQTSSGDGDEVEEEEEEDEEVEVEVDRDSFSLATEDVAERHLFATTGTLRRRSSSKLLPSTSSGGLSTEEQKSILSNVAQGIVEKAVATMRQECDGQLLLRERVIQGLLATIVLLLLFVVYLYYNTNAKVAALEKLLQK